MANAAFTVQNDFSATGNVTLGSFLTTLQLANLTTAQINSISPVTQGMTVYNYTSGNIQVYTGSKWGNLVIS